MTPEPPIADFTIHTSEHAWFEAFAVAWKKRQPVVVIDDAQVGIDPSTQSLLSMGKTSGLGAKEWSGVLVSLGLSGAGLWMVVAAIIDPEPTSKLGLLIAGGTLLIYSGALSAVRLLTQQRPPSVEITATGIRISWD